MELAISRPINLWDNRILPRGKYLPVFVLFDFYVCNLSIQPICSCLNEYMYCRLAGMIKVTRQE